MARTVKTWVRIALKIRQEMKTVLSFIKIAYRRPDLERACKRGILWRKS